MREPQQQQQTLLDEEQTLVVGGEETTLVAPRFDDEETLIARPVVPLEAREFEAAPEPTPPAPFYAQPRAPRRSWMLALMLVSVLVGGVLGGAGLYLYQRQAHDPSATPAATTQPEPPNDTAQTPAEAQEQQAATDAEPPAQQAEAPAAVETTAPAPVEEAPAAAPAREPESVPAAERRTAPAEGTPKHGKKGDRDEEIERRTTTPPAGKVARASDTEARRVDSIFYRPRRAERRPRRGDDVDRLRRIFEGGPE